MSSKEIVIDIVQRLPEELSIAEIVKEIEFVAGIRDAIREFDEGADISAEELMREIPEWAAKATK
jgi:hypothetical protein